MPLAFARLVPARHELCQVRAVIEEPFEPRFEIGQRIEQVGHGVWFEERGDSCAGRNFADFILRAVLSVVIDKDVKSAIARVRWA